MRAVIWTPAAEGDLEEILYYIGVSAGRPSTAKRLGDEIRLAVDHHQTIGAPDRRHPDLPAAWSYLIFKRWIIAYELTGDEMIVHRVVDASRDLPTQFEQW
jgi:plasmid stabilization system protein ParE